MVTAAASKSGVNTPVRPRTWGLSVLDESDYVHLLWGPMGWADLGGSEDANVCPACVAFAEDVLVPMSAPVQVRLADHAGRPEVIRPPPAIGCVDGLPGLGI